MTKLDVYDIQGNLLKAYGRFGFPFARYVFFEFHDVDKACGFIKKIVPLVTNASPWEKPKEKKPKEENSKTSNAPDSKIAIPKVTTNIAFSYQGLKNLGLPRISLQSFPAEFAMGMKERRDILGDNLASAPKHWDPVWQNDVHCWVSINGVSVKEIEDRYQQILEFVAASEKGVTLLTGHIGEDGKPYDYQSAAALVKDGEATPREHFNFVDGIGEPSFKGSQTPLLGNGKRTNKPADSLDGWKQLETGEFILGHRDEGFGYPESAPLPRLLGLNGTYMVYRKLHQNVGSFNNYVTKAGEKYEGGAEALAAKFVGRWRNGAPLALFPTEAEADEFIKALGEARVKMQNAKDNEREQARKEYEALKDKRRGFDYDNSGKCPVGAHIHRMNPRSALEYGNKNAFHTPSALADRRRILRRGLPYGAAKNTDDYTDDGNHGIIFMAINSSIKGQFEFVQQQWANYGNDFKLSNDKDPIIGNQPADGGKMVVQNDPKGDKPPFFCSAIPRFVETRGGEYFFIPSLTALRRIAEGLIDPT